MNKTLTTSLSGLALAALLAAAPTFAQEAATDAPADADQAPAQTEGTQGDLNLDMGTPVGEGQPAEGEETLGQTYIKEVSGDWEIHCVRTELEADPCALHQLLRDSSDNAVATIEMVNLPAGQQAAAGATIVTPLETLLTEQITLAVDGGQGRKYPFSFCTQRGCVARVGFTDGAVDTFRRGNQATLTIVPAAAPDQQVVLTVSLTGFTAGFETLVELNNANAAAIENAAGAQGQNGN